MRYVRCIHNAGFVYDQNGKLFDPTIDDLEVDRVYRVAFPVENDGAMLRVIDGSGEDYLYPVEYFEPWEPNGQVSHCGAVTVYLDDYIKGILHAEARAAKKSVSALLRTWIEERLDLPDRAH